MSLNNRGWGLQELIVGLGVLFFSLLLIVVLVNKNFKTLENTLNKNNGNSSVDKENSNRPSNEENYSSYKKIEQAMVEAATNYNKDIYGASLQEGDNLTVTMRSLNRDGYLKIIKDIKDDSIICSGYVTFKKEGNKVTYNPYLKCGKRYTTKGYLDRLDADI